MGKKKRSPLQLSSKIHAEKCLDFLKSQECENPRCFWTKRLAWLGFFSANPKKNIDTSTWCVTALLVPQGSVCFACENPWLCHHDMTKLTGKLLNAWGHGVVLAVYIFQKNNRKNVQGPSNAVYLLNKHDIHEKYLWPLKQLNKNPKNKQMCRKKQNPWGTKSPCENACNATWITACPLTISILEFKSQWVLFQRTHWLLHSTNQQLKSRTKNSKWATKKRKGS